MKLVSNKKRLAFVAMVVAVLGVAPAQAQNGQPFQSVQTDINTLKAQVATLATQASVAALQGQLAGLATQASVAALQAQVDALASQASVSALQMQVANLSAVVANLQTQSSKATEVWRIGRLSGTGAGNFSPAQGFLFSSAGSPLCIPPACTGYAASFDVVSVEAQRVRQLRVMVGSRTGTYGQGVYLSVEVRSIVDSAVLRVISTTPINLGAANVLQSVEVPITDSDLAIVAPGEYLGIRVSPGGPYGGNLVLRLFLSALVQTP